MNTKCDVANFLCIFAGSSSTFNGLANKIDRKT